MNSGINSANFTIFFTKVLIRDHLHETEHSNNLISIPNGCCFSPLTGTAAEGRGEFEIATIKITVSTTAAMDRSDDRARSTIKAM